ncbi:FGGY-family carbohydrate kinase [Anaerolentibacter hominis]|uniref:FGGY-family carbohydrate kinase n=1 Tax=Anaerolentibacter hominis TaxID=3079009 RepID=UPI0031B83E84
MAVAGIDVGTTGCKCTVYSDRGDFINEAYVEYDFPPEAGDRELDALVIWQGVKQVMKEAARGTEDLKAVGIASMGEAAVLLDEADRPLNRPILYFDPRGQEQIDRLIAKIGEQKLKDITRMNPSKIYTLPKIMWLMDQDPSLSGRAKRLLLMQDYIVYMLSGIAQIDYTLASRTYAFDMNTLDWNDEILQAAGLSRGMMGKTVPTGTAAGMIRREIAQELNLPEDVLIVSGAHDQPAAMIGTGVLRPGMGADSTGTNECISTFFEGRKHPDYMEQRELAVVPFLWPDTYMTSIFCFTGGGMLKWYRDNLAKYEAELIRREGGNVFERLDEMTEDGPSGLLVLPYFLGKGSPGMNPDARGAIVGLTPETKSIAIYKALMEGVTYELRTGLEFWRERGIDIKELRATGGGAFSSVWLQIKADIYGMPVSTLKVSQGGNLACGMLAAIARGLYKNVEEAEKVFIQVDKTYYPRLKMQKRYDEWYEKYKLIYPGMEKLFTAW